MRLLPAPPSLRLRLRRSPPSLRLHLRLRLRLRLRLLSWRLRLHLPPPLRRLRDAVVALLKGVVRVVVPPGLPGVPPPVRLRRAGVLGLRVPLLRRLP